MDIYPEVGLTGTFGLFVLRLEGICPHLPHWALGKKWRRACLFYANFKYAAIFEGSIKTELWLSGSIPYDIPSLSRLYHNQEARMEPFKIINAILFGKQDH